jgi:hypothetical protein
MYISSRNMGQRTKVIVVVRIVEKNPKPTTVADIVRTRDLLPTTVYTN